MDDHFQNNHQHHPCDKISGLLCPDTRTCLPSHSLNSNCSPSPSTSTSPILSFYLNHSDVFSNTVIGDTHLSKRCFKLFAVIFIKFTLIPSGHGNAHIQCVGRCREGPKYQMPGIVATQYLFQSFTQIIINFRIISIFVIAVSSIP